MHPSSRHGKFFLLAICLVALTLPDLSEEFGLFGGGDKNDVEDRKKAPKSVSDKKFKFHKLKKVDLADYEADDNNDDDDDEGPVKDDDEDDDNDDENNSENDEDDNEDDDDDNGSEEGPKKKSRSIFKMILDEEEREEAEEAKRDSDDDSDGFFSFSWIWGSEEKKTKKEKDSNGIINWLRSWRKSSKEDSDDDDGEDDDSPPKESKSWLSYLNRWPFNVLVPFGKSKKIRLPKCDDTSGDSGTEPLSQEHFESLLHTMPGFVVNVQKVSDPECRQQLKVFHHQLRGNKLWPIQS